MTYFSFAFWIKVLSHSIPPRASILNQSALGSRIDRCSSRSASGNGGRPRGFLVGSMQQFYVIQIYLTNRNY